MSIEQSGLGSEIDRTTIMVDLGQRWDTRSDRISKATQQFSKITKNTHVLALNAKIQAARAGDSGRWFAIVAHGVEVTSHNVNDVMAEIETVFAEFKSETQEFLCKVAQSKAA